MTVLRVIVTTVCVLALLDCGDSTGPRSSVSIAANDSHFALGSVISVTITNKSHSQLFVREYSELEYRDATTWRALSVAGCGLAVNAWWTTLDPGEVAVCRHGTASTWPSGEYRLLVLVQDDTIMRPNFSYSNTFRLGN